MKKNQLIKLVVLNTVIALSNIILFSEGLIGLKLAQASTFGLAFGITWLLTSVMVFFAGNYRILNNQPKIIQIKDFNTADECLATLKMYDIKKTFTKDVAAITEQTVRFIQKREAINDFLHQKFNSGELSFSKFEGVVVDVEKVFFINIKSILNKINAFDEIDYKRVTSGTMNNQFSKEFIQSKMDVYNEYFRFIKEAIQDGEELLLKFDRLLLELSKFNSLEDGEIEDMVAIKEIDELIKKAKYYK